MKVQITHNDIIVWSTTKLYQSGELKGIDNKPWNLTNSSVSNDDEEKIVEKIIEGDKIEELQKLIKEKGIKAISPITKSFNQNYEK